MNNSLITLNNVKKHYHTIAEEILAVDNINLSVEKGEFISLVGPSGCGKTTILSMIAGLLRPSNGKLFIDNEEVKGPSQRIGYMLQQDYLLKWRTIEQNIYLGLEIQGRLDSKTKSYALYLLDEMGLSAFKSSYPSQLSGGMRQRVALVRTLATNPDILLLDEPFSALDYQTKLKLEDLVIETIRKHEKTAILVTHDIGEAIAMSDRVVILGRNPGFVKEIVTIPDELRDPLPFNSREMALFQTYFKRIWEGMEDHD